MDFSAIPGQVIKKTIDTVIRNIEIIGVNLTLQISCNHRNISHHFHWRKNQQSILKKSLFVKVDILLIFSLYFLLFLSSIIR